MKLGDLLNRLAAKQGLQNNQALIDLLSNADFANREVADDFANSLDSGLMSLDGAKNNPALLNHFKPILLKAADDKFAILAEKYGISDEISQEKSTYKKFDILEQKFENKLAELKAKGGKGEDTERLTSQIADLQKQLATLNESKTNELKALAEKHQAEQMGMLVDFELAGKNFANKQLDRQINVLTAKTLLNAKLQESKAIIVNENGALKLKQAENPTMDFVDSGYKPVSFADFTDKVLADAKLLEVSGGGQKPQQQQQVIVQTQPQINSTKFAAAIAQAQANNGGAN